ncbi:MAG: Hpt domain-containing protein [Ruminococcus sp.]|nr:Hpt domain-containing protein [Ruminococcus sp.]
MNLKECYTALGGDYESVLSRLMTERLVNKFVLKFLNDASYENLVKSINDGNIEDAFRAAHTLKGVCQNLSFDRLFKSSNEITEVLRDGDIVKANELLPKIEADYKQTVDAINSLD